MSLLPRFSDAFGLPCSTPGRLDVVVGYLFAPGLASQVVRVPTEGNFRIICDNLATTRTPEQLVCGTHTLEGIAGVVTSWEHQSRPQAARVTEVTVDGFVRGLELTEQTEENRLAGLRLLELLDARRLQVRVHTHGPLTARFGLAKAADGSIAAAWVGTTNPLLPPELDASSVVAPVSDPAARNDLARHFDRLWDRATDATAALAEAIRRSWIAFLASPYDVYMKVLYTLVRDRLDFDPVELPGDEDVTDRLADFQRAAFRQAVRVIQEHGGAFVADVVGLGKSFVGAAVVRHFERTEGARPLIVCPAPLVPMWEMYNETHRLNARIVSTGLLRSTDGGNPLLADVRYRDRDFVLVDESHSFRNHGTQRYRVLSEFMAQGRRRACLLTATPRNRSAWDVYHQIKLFHPDDCTTLPVEPPNLREFFRLAENGERPLPMLLGHLLVRRTRNHVLRFYGRDAETGRPVDPNQFEPYRDGTRRAYIEVGGRRQFFPRRELSTAQYSIDATYRGLYERLRLFLTPPRPEDPDQQRERLTFARYRTGDYLNPDALTRPVYATLRNTSGLHGLIRVMLFKRLESSLEAFRLTVRRLIDTHREMLRALADGVVPLGSPSEAVEDGDEAGDEVSGRYAIEDFDAQRLREDLEHDLSILSRVLGMIELITPAEDEKLKTLIRLLETPPLLGAKRLIFTQFADTARYLHANLAPLGVAGARVAVLTSQVADKMPTVARFAPKANPVAGPVDPDEAIGTLISTDVLSEGLNLQDAAAVVNYDLHWNPVRLIQRFGRVDRIGSEHDRVLAWNFLPETELERNLGLREVLRCRIREIHATIGEDSSILEIGEELNHQEMYAIYDGTLRTDAIEDNEPTGLQLNDIEELLRHLRETAPAEFKRIAALPDGLRSTRRSGQLGVFAFLQAGNYQELALFDERGHRVQSELQQLLKLLRCPPRTPTAGEYPLELVRVLVNSTRAFATRTAERETEARYALALTQAQRYVLRELQAVAESLVQVEERNRVDRLASLFRAPMTPAAQREVNRAQREGLTGQPLVTLLSRVAHAYGLSERETSDATNAHQGAARVICSLAFTTREGLVSGPK